MRRQSATAVVRSEKAEFLFIEYGWYRSTGNHEKALVSLKKALRLDPGNNLLLEEMVQLDYDMASLEEYYEDRILLTFE